MYVIYHSSDAFADVTGVSIASLFENNRHFEEIHVLYIEKGMSQTNKEKLQQLAETYGRTITLGMAGFRLQPSFFDGICAGNDRQGAVS